LGQTARRLYFQSYGVEDTDKGDNMEELENEAMEEVEEEVELHTCPYAEEIHNDYTSLCSCDEEQMYQCMMDI